MCILRAGKYGSNYTVYVATAFTQHFAPDAVAVLSQGALEIHVGPPPRAVARVRRPRRRVRVSVQVKSSVLWMH